MKKATKKTSTARAETAPQPSRLGTKRTCPKCATKFYDFEKEEVTCPKCSTEIDTTKPAPTLRIQPPEVKKKPVEEIAAEALSSSDDISIEGGEQLIESVDDLGDDDDEITQDIEVKEEEDEDY